MLDVGGAGGDDTYSLGAGTWKGLGTPAGSKGWKYKGAGTASDPCKVVLIKEKIVKAVCKDKGAGGIALTTPFSGTGQIILTVGSDRYCGEWGGTEKKNDVKLVKRMDAAAPSSCAATAPTCDGCNLCFEMCSDPACDSDPTCGWFDLDELNDCLGFIGPVASGCDFLQACFEACFFDPEGFACQNLCVTCDQSPAVCSP